ncbi:MAG: aromatic-L-amino-acid/L-tryptophan decarboxylase, partial [Solirubrobacteraceae bacterium]|nr:aromatic-L-amino-acid/L-tryptophan decarboxylase [Solirubrobacteraceae bacterium]
LATGLAGAGWRIANDTPLPVVCVAQDGADAAWHLAVVERVVGSGAAWVSPVTLAGQPAIRTCVISYRTTAHDVDALVEALGEARAMSSLNARG